MRNFILKQIKESLEIKKRILSDENMINEIVNVSSLIVDSYKKGGKTIIAGNGGSAADAQHIAAEFVSRFYFDRPGLASIALTTDTSILTAIGNDYGFDKLFLRQLQANSGPDDIFIAISTSGNSENIIEALKFCNENSIKSVGLTGAAGGKMYDLCDMCLKVPSNETPRIQESHILIGHIICSIVEESIFGEQYKCRQ